MCYGNINVVSIPVIAEHLVDKILSKLSLLVDNKEGNASFAQAPARMVFRMGIRVGSERVLYFIFRSLIVMQR